MMTMTEYGGPELASSFRTVRKNTVQIAEEIPEDKYDFVPAPGARSVRALLSHIALAPRLQDDMHRVNRLKTLEGYDFPATVARLATQEGKPRGKTEIIALLKSEGETFAAWLESLTPDELNERITDFGANRARTRLEHLMGVKEHEMHHRGQLMLIQRMLGGVPHLTRQREERMRARQQASSAAR
jgi:uncharacterized damage-inducible protein DinB